MKTVLEMMQRFRDVYHGPNSDASAYGRKFIDGLSIVMTNIDEGFCANRAEGDWIYESCLFADQRKNHFTFRPKFARLMTQTDKDAAKIVINKLRNRTVRGVTFSPHLWKDDAVGHIVNTCNMIESAIQG
jgi:hypothetical protein